MIVGVLKETVSQAFQPLLVKKILIRQICLLSKISKKELLKQQKL